MFKYEMIIDNENYNALFIDHMEAADFIDDVAWDSEIQVLGFKEVTIDEIKADHDFDEAYKIEMIGSFVFPNIKFEKTIEVENALRIIGIL